MVHAAQAQDLEIFTALGNLLFHFRHPYVPPPVPIATSSRGYNSHTGRGPVCWNASLPPTQRPSNCPQYPPSASSQVPGKMVPSVYCTVNTANVIIFAPGATVTAKMETSYSYANFTHDPNIAYCCEWEPPLSHLGWGVVPHSSQHAGIQELVAATKLYLPQHFARLLAIMMEDWFSGRRVPSSAGPACLDICSLCC